MLTRDECEKALDHFEKCYWDQDNSYSAMNGVRKDLDILNELIYEHFKKNTLVKCEKCGKEMPYLLVEMFNRDGSDSFLKYSYNRIEGYISIVTDSNWAGYELSEEEMLETIVCPHCGKYPFQSKEIHVYDEVEIVMFPRKEEDVD